MTLEPRGSVIEPQVVVGLGNEIVRDDGVGILAARRLTSLLKGRDDVAVLTLPWAGFALLDVLAGRRRAALIDCLVTGHHAPGTIVRLGEHDVRGSVRLVSFHDLNFPTVLALGRKMGLRLPAEIAIWAIEGDVVDEFGIGLSTPVAAAARQVVGDVVEFVQSPMVPSRALSTCPPLGEPQPTSAGGPLAATRPTAYPVGAAR